MRIEREICRRVITTLPGDRRIRVLTGMHRSGKTQAMKGIADLLLQAGFTPEQILYVDCSRQGASSLKDGGALLFKVRGMARSGSMLALFFDEVENLDDWRRSVETLHTQFDCLVFVSGNHAAFSWSGDDALDSRLYTEVPVWPYSFREYRQALAQEDEAASRQDGETDEAAARTGGKTGEALMRQGGETDEAEALRRFIRYGSSPAILPLHFAEENVYPFLRDVAQSAILTDVVQRKMLRNVAQVMMVFQCLTDNLGRALSAKVIAQFLKEQGGSVGKDTVYSVLKALNSSGLFVKVPRYDLKSGRALEANEKYYFADWGISHAFLTPLSSEDERGAWRRALMENIVCMEFLARGYEVYRIQTFEEEVDFLTFRAAGAPRYPQFWQVCDRLPTEEVVEDLIASFPAAAPAGARFVIVAETDPVRGDGNDGADGIAGSIGSIGIGNGGMQLGLSGIGSADQAMYLKMRLQEAGIEWVSFTDFIAAPEL